VAIRVDTRTSSPWCVGPNNLVVARPFSGVATIPGSSTRRLSQLPSVAPTQWPLVRMANLSTNQDACKSARFTLRYTATVTK
jgi:hypothetical protein